MPAALVNNSLFVDFDDPISGYDSAGRPLTKEQSEFFRHSKCLDEDGSLFLVYHAANSDYDTFDANRIGTGAGNIFGKGIYFSAEPDSVKIYGNKIKSYYLNLKNPFIYYAADSTEDALYNVDNFIKVLEKNGWSVTDELRADLEEDVLRNDGGLDTLIELTCGADQATNFFQKCGYDGIMNLDVLDFVVYSPGQIKKSSNKSPSTALSTVA